MCRALVLSGGGTLGAWEAGILYGLVNNGNPEDFNYHVGSGVSIGSINSSILSAFAPEDAVESAEFLSNEWANLSNP